MVFQRMRLYVLFSSAALQVTSRPSFHGTIPVVRHEVWGPLWCCPIFLALVQYPKSCTVGVSCRVLQELWKNQTQLVLSIFNEEKLQSISPPELVLFSAKSSQCKASTALGIWQFFVGNCLCYCASGCPRCSSWALKNDCFCSCRWLYQLQTKWVMEGSAYLVRFP